MLERFTVALNRRSSHPQRHRWAVLTGVCAAIVAAVLVARPTASHAADGMRPCDIYGRAGTPCVAAHSTTRALYAQYAGPLYRVARRKDGTERDIGLLAPSGVADAAAQDKFCSGARCIIMRIYDQTPNHNDLTIEGPGQRAPADRGASASALPVIVDGQSAYGLFIRAGMGYRNDVTRGVARHGQPETMYMVSSGTHVNNQCCFDYGNAEHNNRDNGNGTMDAVNFSTICGRRRCFGAGPWVQADLENGLFMSAQGGSVDPTDTGTTSPFVTALLKNDGHTFFALRVGDGQRGDLKTTYRGPLPLWKRGYSPMRTEGAIVLGTGGDNTNKSIGSFFEGVMTAGVSSPAADQAVQRDIVRAGYRLPSSNAVVTSPLFPGVTCQSIQVPMRDGTRLTTEVYLPVKGGRYPVVMERTPYADATHQLVQSCFNLNINNVAPIIRFAQHGYAGVSQDSRGTYTSEGTFHAMTQEAQDGYDAIEWAAKQAWSTGKVGTWGGSYIGLTQWQPAINAPPHLAAIAPAITASDYHDNWTYVNGVLDLWFAQSWLAGSFVPDQLFREGRALGYSAAQITTAEANWAADVNANMVSRWNWELPLTDFPQFQSLAPYYYDWLDHEYYDSYWAALDVETRYQNVRVPALNFGDWFDIFGVGTVRNYTGLRARGATQQARTGTELVMGAYGHPGDSGTPTFGNDTPDPNIALHFFDRYLKGINDGASGLNHFYVLVPPNAGEKGSGFWITAPSYPLPGTTPTRLYLKSGGHANSRLGDGSLVTSSANGAPSDRFTYDPAHPVPTVGGAMCCNKFLIPEGARDQGAVELRNDVLVYTTEKLRRDYAVIGTVNADFWATTSAADTDFTVKFVDVHPDGRSHNVLDRIVRASLRRGSKLAARYIMPGKPYEYTLELGNTGTIFRAGHQVRIEISSSSFPHYARNLNTGLSNNFTSRTVVAQQTILHDFAHPSFVEFPVVPGVTIPTDQRALQTSYPDALNQQQQPY